MKKILLGILITGIFVYGGDPLVAKRLEQNIMQCYKQTPEVYQKANAFLANVVRIGAFTKDSWDITMIIMKSANEFRTAILLNCDKEIENAILNANSEETLDLLREFTDYTIGF